MQITPSMAARKRMRRENLIGYAYMMPAILFFLSFVIFPMGMALVTSFTDYSMDSFNFIGLSNYRRMLQDRVFGKAMGNTILIVLVSVPAVTLFSLWVASLVYKMNKHASSFFRVVFYMPIVTGTVAVTVVWKWMFSRYNGLLNYVLNSIGLINGNISWLGDEAYAIWCIILILFTTSIGQPIVLYISALANVDQSLVEASEVDGANNFQLFWKIKWPQIMNTTLYILVITTINSFQIFALIQLLTSGGPNNATNTIMYNIYYHAFKLNEYGYGNAMGIILAIVIGVFSMIQFKLARSDKE
ncbi:MAG: sugar ABC transporter permease [Clostridiales bacterium]|nr:sugar ABC transporter permease [Clostridiales bacterium]